MQKIIQTQTKKNNTFAEYDWNVVGSQLTLAFNTDQQRRTASCRGQFTWKVNTLEQEREGSLQLSNHQLD